MNNPKISVISTNYNHGRFIRATIESVLGQSYDSFEYIVVDGASRDESVTILKEYPQIRWISEKDDNSYQAFEKGLLMARGEYIMQCAVTDGYLDMDWLRKCATALSENKDISLIWGLSRHMAESGTLMGPAYPQFINSDPPQRHDYFYYWLATFFWFPEGNFCVRKEIFQKCFPPYDPTKYLKSGEVQFDPWLEFNFNFNNRGYLPLFIRSEASFGRFHSDQKSQKEVEDGAGNKVFNAYYELCREYRRSVIWKGGHVWRGSTGETLPIQFSRSRFIWKHLFTIRFVLNYLKPFLRPIIKKMMRNQTVAKILRPLKKYS
ncbi:MAG: glycosyltransferase [Candidatus Liptonbacteria bacterium]